MSAKPSGSEAGVVFSALMPHAPILIEEVGREQLTSAERSVAGMKIAAARLTGSRPQSVVVISPHSPRKAGAFGLWTNPRLYGNLAQFGAPEAALELPNDLALVAELKERIRGAGLEVWDIPNQPLDHGAVVPLLFLTAAGWNGPTTVLSLNYPDEGGLTELGGVIAAAARRLGVRIALIASGDMSHRLTLDAPAGYEVRAHDFDRQFIACLRGGAYRDLELIDPELRDLAGEDVLDSTSVAVAAVNWEAKGREVLSYEGPFGVGYGIAVLFDSKTTTTRRKDIPLVERCRAIWAKVLPRVARESLTAALWERSERKPAAKEGCLGRASGRIRHYSRSGS